MFPVSLYYCEILLSSSQARELKPEHFFHVHSTFFIPFKKSLIFQERLKITKKRYIIGQLYFYQVQKEVSFHREIVVLRLQAP
jgi:hypothetical protein